jgi:hypothetical protein
MRWCVSLPPGGSRAWQDAVGCSARGVVSPLSFLQGGALTAYFPPRLGQAVDLRRKLLLRGSGAGSERERDDAGGGSPGNSSPLGVARGGGRGAAGEDLLAGGVLGGPVAEAAEDTASTPRGRQRGVSVTEGLQRNGAAGSGGSFMGKFTSWFSLGGRNRSANLDSFSTHDPGSAGGAGGGWPVSPPAGGPTSVGAAVAADGDLPQPASQPPSQPGSASNSFNVAAVGARAATASSALPPALSALLPTSTLGSGVLGGGGKAGRGDPVTEEVSNSRLSLKVGGKEGWSARRARARGRAADRPPCRAGCRLAPASSSSSWLFMLGRSTRSHSSCAQVMTSAGSVCVFNVGGGVDEVTDPSLPEIPRWEFFIGDRPLAPRLDANQRRRCISQVPFCVAQGRDPCLGGRVRAAAHGVRW